MPKYTITLVKENGYQKYHKLTVEAENSKEAFSKTVKDAEEKGIELPSEIWVRSKKH